MKKFPKYIRDDLILAAQGKYQTNLNVLILSTLKIYEVIFFDKKNNLLHIKKDKESLCLINLCEEGETFLLCINWNEALSKASKILRKQENK